MDSGNARWHAEQAALYLDRVRGLSVKVKSLTMTIQELEAKAEGVGAMRYDKDNVKTSPTDDTMPNNVSRLIELKAERERKLELYQKEIDAVFRALDRMENLTYSAALEMHYVNGVSWKDVRHKLGYSKPHMMTIRQKALTDFYEVMPPSEHFIGVPKAI